MSKILETKALCVNYGKYEALEDINVTINSGDYVGIVGPNGSGKSTFVKTIASLIDKKSGDIELGTSRISYMPQNIDREDKLFPISAREVIQMGLTKKNDKLVEEVANELGILEILPKRIGDLSGGQKQKVLLARTIINRPDILILDEPTSALDKASRENFYKLIRDINVKRKTTVILVSHDVHTIWKYVDKVLYIDKTVKFFGSGEEYFDKYERNN